MKMVQPVAGKRPAVEFERHAIARLLAAAALVLLHSCASLPTDSGRSAVADLLENRGMPLPGESAAVAALTATPLTAEQAIALALYNNPQLRRDYAALDLAAADRYRGTRVSNPLLEAVVLDSDQPGDLDLKTFGLVASLTDLLTLPARRRQTAAAFVATQEALGNRLWTLATDAERAFYAYEGTRQHASLQEQIAKAARVAADLAQRFFAAGNLNAWDLALQEAEASRLRLEFLDAQAQELAARAALGNLLGLSMGDPWETAGRLRLPLAREDELAELLALSGRHRLDLKAAKSRVLQLADQKDQVAWSRWLDGIEVGFERERETDGAELEGPRLDWSIPLLNQRGDQQLRAGAELDAALGRVQELTVAIDNEVRLAHASMLNIRARIDEIRKQLIPQRVASVARAQEQVNFMLAGVFELLEIKQQEYDAYRDYLAALTDYWVQRAQLRRAVGHALPSASQDTDSVDVDQLIQPAPDADLQHGGHHHHHKNMTDGENP
ncbi:MAG: TolC family protein [Pseudomonadota bacterium]